jgi:hypothetical protein
MAGTGSLGWRLMDYLCVVVSVILILFIAGCNKMSIELGTEDFPEDLASTDMYILFFFYILSFLYHT